MKRLYILTIAILINFNSLFAPELSDEQEKVKQVTKANIIRLDELMNAEFSSDALRELLVLLGAPSPEIAYKQARLESGNFTSRVFKEGNNLFGMHFPRIRDSYAHEYMIADNGKKVAKYRSWQSSVLDLMLYFEYYESLGYDTSDYYQFLVDASYCEGSQYVNILKSMSKVYYGIQ